MLPNGRLDPPAVPPRTKRNVEIAPRILEQRSKVVEFDREKGIRRDVERCLPPPPESLSIPPVWFSTGFTIFPDRVSFGFGMGRGRREGERNERNEEGRTEYDDVVGRSMRGRYEPCERARFAVAAVWNGGTERAGSASPVIKAARTGGEGVQDSRFGGVFSNLCPIEIG